MLTNKNTEQQVCVNKKLKYMLCYAVMLFIATGCSSLPYERNNIKDNIGGSPATPVLNYENRARQYDKVIPYSHFKIYTHSIVSGICNPCVFQEERSNA